MKKLIISTIAILMSACGGGGGGGGASAIGGGAEDVPDFTPRTYYFRIIGNTAAPFTQNLNLAMECNINAGPPSYRNENSNFNFNSGELGGIGCANIYNVKFTLTNSSPNQANWYVFVDYGSGEVQIATGSVAAGQTQAVFQQGYIQP